MKKDIFEKAFELDSFRDKIPLIDSRNVGYRTYKKRKQDLFNNFL